ncbi:MAG: hypothetical protein RLY66_334 [Candidatus Parcubacteria bacterium]|jgi:hypothetical protein
MAKKKLFLTDLTLHSKEHRATPNLEKAEQRKENGYSSPRLYSPQLNKDDFKIYPDGKFEIIIKLPPDIQKGLDSGEIEIVIPKDGLLVYAGKDMIEKAKQLEEKKRREIIHRGRRQVWRKE